MATKVDCESYFSVFHPMRDLNENMSNNWSLYYEDKTFDGQVYHDRELRPTNGYSGYHKEMLRKTMLEHEAIFRRQVYELHRLYKIQRDLMDELIGKQLGRSVPACTYQTTMTGTDEKRTPLNFLKQENLQCSSVRNEARGSLNDDRMFNCNSNKIPKKMFDLHLPADVYIECEDADKTENGTVSTSLSRSPDPLNIICSEPEKAVQLTLATGENSSSRQGSLQSDKCPRHYLSIHRLADLNEPSEDLHGEIPEISYFSHFDVIKTHSAETGGPLEIKPNKCLLHMDFFTARERDELTSTKLSHRDKQKVKQKGSLLYNDACQSQAVGDLSSALSSEKTPLSFEPIQLKLKKSHGIYLDDLEKTDTRLMERETKLVEMSGRSPQLVKSVLHSEVPAHKLTDHLTASAPISSQRKRVNSISHIPIAVQALPCFERSALIKAQGKRTRAIIQNSGTACEELQMNDSVRFDRQSGNKSCPNGQNLESNSSMHLRYPPFTLEKQEISMKCNASINENSGNLDMQKHLKNSKCTDLQFMNGVNWNQHVSNEPRNGFITLLGDLGKYAEASKGLHLPRTNPVSTESVGKNELASHMSVGFPENNQPLMSNYDNLVPNARKEDRTKGSSLSVRQLSLSSLHVKDSIVERSGTSVEPNGAFLGFPFQRDHGLHSFLYQEQYLAGDTKSSGRGKNAKATNVAFWNDINLNSMVPMDENDPICGDENSPSSHSLLCITPEVYGIDLEAPADGWKEDRIFSRSEIMGKMRNKTIDVSLNTKYGLGDSGFSHDTTLRVAAESIVSLSLDACSQADDITCSSLVPSSCVSLQWFAEVATSNAENIGVPKFGGGDGLEPLYDNGLDLFEAMTLNLEEMKADEYMCKHREQENWKDADSHSAALLLTMSRRGKLRKRRQRKDFQKDILPGLATLSRHEVNEDLQSLGGLMRESGKSWQKASAMRGRGRNKSSCQTRGRRRPRSLAVTVSEILVSPPAPQPTHTETEITERSIMLWGRTTRRCSRQRNQVGNFSATQI
ncbi:uncharacterized protein [Typha latifolia]|uniref:uncharacterized protein isoform X1 n=1 Tax=Typha latifolia TaxID=4733 RepID=UPI003C2D73F5